jgi:uncharacterized protein YecE (DUF72 family)
MAQIWVGTSGYVYRHWREGVFYPAGLRARDELAWYATRFRTVELNNPFYRVPSAETVDRWRDATPDDFVFAVKVNRQISHFQRLRDTAAPLHAFVTLMRRLGPKLGPLLVQLPPGLPMDLPRLVAFLELLDQDLRWTLEVRHSSWQTAAVYDALARYGVGLCVPVGGRVQPDLVTTAGFSYIRLHVGEAPGGGFSNEQIGRWSARVRALARSGKDVYAYFNNDREGHAVRDAAHLLGRLRLAR